MKRTVMVVFTVLVVTVAVLFPKTIEAQGTTYVSNLAEVSNGSMAVGSDSWIAEVFGTGTNSGGYILNSVQLLTDTPTGSPGDFDILLYSSVSRAPGISLEHLSGADPASSGVSSYLSSGIKLQPHTAYFIVVTATTPVAQGGYYWNIASTYNYASSEYWSLPNYFYTSDDGSSWTGPLPPGRDRQPSFQFAVEATAIPEPSVIPLLLLGGGILFCTRRSGQRLFNPR